MEQPLARRRRGRWNEALSRTDPAEHCQLTADSRLSQPSVQPSPRDENFFSDPTPETDMENDRRDRRVETERQGNGQRGFACSMKIQIDWKTRMMSSIFPSPRVIDYCLSYCNLYNQLD